MYGDERLPLLMREYVLIDLKRAKCPGWRWVSLGISYYSVRSTYLSENIVSTDQLGVPNSYGRCIYLCNVFLYLI